MKRKISYILSSLALLLLGSCDNGYDLYDGIYINSTLSNNPMVTVIVDDKFPKSVDLIVSSSTHVDQDVWVELSSDASVLEEYNKKYGTLYELFPADDYLLTHPTVVIEKGNMATTVPVKLNITSPKNMREGVQYMIPVSITKVSNGAKVIESSRHLFIALNQVVVAPAIWLENGKYVSTRFIGAAAEALPYDVGDLVKFSAECRVYIDKTDPTYKLNSIFGLEEEFCVRTTGESGKNGELEVTGGGISNLLQKETFTQQKWTHIAITFDGDQTGAGKLSMYIDGELNNSADVKRSRTISLHRQYLQNWDIPSDSKYYGQAGAHMVDDVAPFWIGKSERARWLWGAVSEARLWARVLSPAEIRSNACLVDPTSDDLIAYWRFDEGSGTVYKDYTEHGFDMVLTGGTSTDWVDIRCPEDN